MGSSCCKGKKEHKKIHKVVEHQEYPESPNSITIRSKSPTPRATREMNSKVITSKSDYKEKNIINFEPEEEANQEKVLFDEKMLKNELKNNVRGGTSAYGNFKSKRKPLQDSEYNKNGLIDQNSKEFKFVHKLMKSKGYNVIESAGSGNYAEVYRAETAPGKDKTRKKPVAIKVIDLRKANANYRVNFLPREIAILRQLKHPNVIKVYMIQQNDNKILIVMEWADNGTFADLLKEHGALSETFAQTLFKEVLKALNFMHSMRIAHRDIKLENILLTAKGNPKLSDFSYAIVVDEKNPLSKTFCGSIPYFSPEILQRIPYNPFISDVWSFGVCLFIILDDCLPFNIKSEKVMIEKQLNKEYEFRKKVEPVLSHEIKSLINKMLEPNVDKRITTQQLTNESWFRQKY